jgi:ABC-2 type transport system permease protein
MKTFKAYFKKEILESIRQYRYLILAIGILLFAIMDPIMLKLLPVIMKSQIPADLSSLMVFTPKTAAQNYIKDLYQVGLMFVIFALSGTLSDEISNGKLIFPYSMGGRPSGIVLAKVLHNISTTAILTFIGFSLNYYYICILFTGEALSYNQILISAFLTIVFYSFAITLVTLFSSIFKKGIISGAITISIIYLTSTLANFKSLGKFIPYKLIAGANTFSFKSMEFPVIFTVIECIIFAVITIQRMKKVEVI